MINLPKNDEGTCERLKYDDNSNIPCRTMRKYFHKAAINFRRRSVGFLATGSGRENFRPSR
jgi:hypothetical protein